MDKIIERIEKYRKDQRVKKSQLTDYCKLSVNTYTAYLKGAKMPYDVVVMMLDYLGKSILIYDRE